MFPNLITPIGPYGFPFITSGRSTSKHHESAGPTTRRSTGNSEDGLPAAGRSAWTVFDQIMSEDFANMAPMQRSLESPAMRGIPINYQERRIWHFHEQLDRMIGVEHIAPELRIEQLLGDYVER